MCGAGCARFGDELSLGPPDGVVTRPDGPATSVVTTGARAVAAFTVTSDGRTSVWLFELDGDHAGRRLSAPSARATQPPLAMARPDGRITVAWREIDATAGRILWSEGDGADRPFSPPRALPAVFASDPHGGGEPPTLIASQGRPLRPGDPLETPLDMWQRSPSQPDGWTRLPPALSGRPLEYAARGTRPGAAIAAIAAERGNLQLTVTGPGAPAATTLPGAVPAAPRPIWLGAYADALLVGWSERTFGMQGHAAVRLARSTDAGATWTPQALMKSWDGLHPYGSFAQDGATVAVVWRASDGVVQRILLCVSDDAAATFASPVAVDDGRAGRDRSRPRVAVLGRRILVAWQEGDEDARQEIYASLSEDGGASFAARAERLASSPSGRTLRNPQPWLLPEGGGVLWESTEDSAPLPGRPPTASSKGSLHLRTLRR